MEIHAQLSPLRQALRDRSPIAFVPTMGNLHEGHIHLMREARQHGKTVVASIFVNRLQFGIGEDFDQYPRTFEADCAKLEAAGVDVLFAPTESVMYPEPQSYFVAPPDLQHLLEGQFRPGHFQGVATVVLKLFNAVQPQAALFGKKDYQQLMLIRAMSQELFLPTQIIGIDTVRAQDGLALSSRNGYLSETERQEAPQLFLSLNHLRQQIMAQGIGQREALENATIQYLDDRGWKTDYVAVRQQANLLPPTDLHQRLVILAATRLGNTRLIDNIEI
ncbi:MAG: pantoate--beta-alanine ligase [Azovibrio sp.]